ncbi:glycosyltransferase family 4 protein [Staphylococcus argenteus]|uniref:glycosyltransferase family 4 protein n=1 Tax=Staphylococcus argenteus TaxID=985002 RepID=UPI001FBB7BC7|nr:glycosyltransferase family 4 protein [Staphylococcus argenteus]GJF59752.1 glycosyltransferase family 4 protein [Staphylococcus argenteus]GJF73229.1 glycosyltransferase family 4 protein [Staphylococcus argenteus]GJF85135.1 glycosyltransferase family 4 protein [Staphylococcus argenteus]
MSKKNILILCQYFYPEYVSSATLPTQLAEDLSAQGINVDVLCGWPYEYSQNNNVSKTETYHDIHIRRLKYSRFNNKSKVGRIINFFSLFSKFALNMPKMLKYDHILVYSNPPILPLIPDVLHRVFKKKYSFVVYDIAPDNAIKTGATRPGSMIDKLMRYINKNVYKHADNVIVLGTEMKNYLVNHQISKNPNNIHIIPNWYDMRQLQDNHIENDTFRTYREQYDKILLYSGNMGQLQDMETLVSFLKLNKNETKILTILCGHGKKFAEVKAAIETYQIENVKMFEFLTGTDYADVLKIADVCFASLIKEGVGLGVPSKNYGYLAAKKPLVLIMDKQSDIVQHVEQYDAGVQIDNGDAQAIYNFINTHSSQALQEMGERAHQLFKDKYTREINTMKYYNLLK